jgi:hypothetical protein
MLLPLGRAALCSVWGVAVLCGVESRLLDILLRLPNTSENLKATYRGEGGRKEGMIRSEECVRRDEGNQVERSDGITRCKNLHASGAHNMLS